MATIATHNGSDIKYEHNVRNRKVTDKEKHIDPNGVHEIWHDEKIRKAYERLFGDAVKAYNKKQEREERKIKSYYNNIRKDAKKHPGYEMIVGVYGSDCSKAQKKEILKEFANGWKERNPNLELIGAYYHEDEPGDPHIHVDYIPVAHGYKNGMETQTGLVKALGEMGFEKIGKETAQIQWERRENKYLEQLCKNRGIVVERPTEAQKEHLDTETYKATKEAEKAKEAAEKAAAALEEVQKELQHTKEQLQPIRAEYESKKEYVNTFDAEFLGAYAHVKENKDFITRKTKSYEVPANVWETQRLYQADKVASEAARTAWETIATDYSKTKEENKKLRGIIDRIEETLSNVSQNVREAFFELFEAKQNKKEVQEKEAVKTQNIEPEER